MNNFTWKRLWLALWDNKQMITGAITTSVSALATAKLISAEAAVIVTTVTGVLITLFALGITIFKSATAPVVPGEPPTGG